MGKFGKGLLSVGSVAGLLLVSACGGGETPDAPEGQAGAANQVENMNMQGPATPAVASTAAPSPPADNVETISGDTFAQFTGDAAAGEAVFAQCRACHVTDPGVNRIGPSLHAIVGREAGTVPGYNYSPANANSGITWTPEKLFQYLENPQRVIPGTKMAFAGIPDSQKRADLIAWLATHGDAAGAAQPAS